MNGPGRIALVLSLGVLCGCIKDIGIPDPFGGGPTVYSVPTSTPTVAECTGNPWSITSVNSSSGFLDLTVGLSKEVSVWRNGCSSSMVTSVAWEVENQSLATVVSLGTSRGVITGWASGRTVLTGRIAFIDGAGQSAQANVLVSPAASPSLNRVSSAQAPMP